MISGTEESGRVEHPIGLRDLAPTIAELGGVEHPFTGRNVLERADSKPWATAKVFTESGRELVFRTASLRYNRQNGLEMVDELTGGTERSIPTNSISTNGLTEQFRELAKRHSATEYEKSTIRNESADLIATGRI